MPGGPPLEGPRGEKLPEPPEEEGATPEASDPRTENLLHIEVGRNVCWKKSNTMLIGQSQYLAGQSGKKRRHCTTLITQVCFSSTVIQMQGNNLTREAEGHPTEHDDNSLKFLLGNMRPRQGT